LGTFRLSQRDVHEGSVLLRAARPTFDDGLAYARHLDEAAEGFFRVMLGGRAENVMATAFTQPGHEYSYRNVTFAERDGTILGMASGYTAEQHRGFSDKALEQAAGGRVFRLRCVRVLLAPLWRLLETLADGDFYLQAIAVDTESRGEGVGTILIDHIEDRARTSGATQLALDVSARNEGARRLYGRRGMDVSFTWPKLRLVPAVLVRMTKLL